MSVKWQGEDLVRVESASELKAGMTVVLVPCAACNRREAILLVRLRLNFKAIHVESGGESRPCKAPTIFDYAGGCVGHPGALPNTTCFCGAIEEGRTYRLQEPTAEVNDYVAETLPVKRGVRA